MRNVEELKDFLDCMFQIFDECLVDNLEGRDVVVIIEKFSPAALVFDEHLLTPSDLLEIWVRLSRRVPRLSQIPPLSDLHSSPVLRLPAERCRPA